MTIQKHLSDPHLSNNGFTLLLSVLVLGAVGATITVSLLLLGIGATRTGFALEKSQRARALANACAEEALQKIRETTSFTGVGMLTLTSDTCTYTVTNTGGQHRIITVTGTAGTVMRKIAITLDKINPEIDIVSWQEVADF